MKQLSWKMQLLVWVTALPTLVMGIMILVSAVGAGVNGASKVLKSIPHSSTSVVKVFYGVHGSWLAGEYRNCVYEAAFGGRLICESPEDSWTDDDKDTGKRFKVTFHGDPVREGVQYQCSKSDGIFCRAVEEAK
jgi:hypothetical protein